MARKITFLTILTRRYDEMANMTVLKTVAARLVGSSPTIGTIILKKGVLNELSEPERYCGMHKS